MSRFCDALSTANTMQSMTCWHAFMTGAAATGGASPSDLRTTRAAPSSSSTQLPVAPCGDSGRDRIEWQATDTPDVDGGDTTGAHARATFGAPKCRSEAPCVRPTMGCGASKSGALTEAEKREAELDRLNRADFERQQQKIKLLLLGPRRRARHNRMRPRHSPRAVRAAAAAASRPPRAAAVAAQRWR